jgi:MoaA/NifB/PqqE/SkfB family radical SAM enzyme
MIPGNDLTPRLSSAVRCGKSFSAIGGFWRKVVGGLQRPPRDKSAPTRLEKKRRWRLLQVESALACNLRCIMCPWIKVRGSALHGGIMAPETWAAIRRHLDEVLSIDFTGGGEPLLQPRLAEWMQDAKTAGCETGILTNGLLLDEERARRLIDVGLDWLCVSIDGADRAQYERIRVGSNFEKVCENLANVSRIRSRGIPKTMINFVMMTANFHQIKDIVKLADRLGVDQVNFKQCEVSRGEHGKAQGLFGRERSREIKRFAKELSAAQALAAKLSIQTTASAFTPSEQPVCDQDPRDSAFVSFDGSVSPCISLAYGGPTTFLGQEVILPSTHYGRLPDRDLLELCETDTCRSYRERFQERVRAYKNSFSASLMGGSCPTPEKLHEEAVKKMPEAPEGCKVCHYLYGI